MLTLQSKRGPEKLKDLPQVTQQVGSRTSNRTQIPGSRTLSIILSYLPYDTMKLEKKIFHGPGLTSTSSLLPPVPFCHCLLRDIHTKNFSGGAKTLYFICSQKTLHMEWQNTGKSDVLCSAKSAGVKKTWVLVPPLPLGTLCKLYALDNDSTLRHFYFFIYENKFNNPNYFTERL